MRVHEAMTREVRAIVEGETIAFARAALIFSSFRHLPVVDPGRRVVGMITAGDLLDPGDDVDPEAPFTIRAAMRRPAVTIGAEEDVAAALPRMRRAGVHALPVVDGAHHLVGILTDVDVLSALAMDRVNDGG